MKRKLTWIDWAFFAFDIVAIAWLLASFTGCDKSTVVNFDVAGKVTTTVADSAAPVPPTAPTDPTTPPVTPPTVPPVTPTGYDLNTQALLLEGFARLDPIGAPDHVALAPLGFAPDWVSPVAGLERQNSSYRWTGALIAPADGEYEFQAKVKSGGSIVIDGELLWSVDREADATSSPATWFKPTFKLTLTKGKAYPLSCSMIYQGFLRGFTLEWMRPGNDTLEPIPAFYLRPPADWQSRLKTYTPPPPEPSPFAEVDWATYQSPPLPRLYPDDHWWNQRVDELPVDPLSDKIIARLGTAWLHPVFGENGAGIPYQLMPDDAPKVHIASFLYAGESDAGPYPIPDKPVVEGGGGDNHCLLVTPTRLYELHHVSKDAAGWHADSGAIFSMDGTTKRPLGWTSADAAGLEILPGLARFEEADSGEIRHKLRITVGKTRRAFVPPANHFTGRAEDLSNRADDLPPMGAILRLKASFDLSAAPPRVKAMLIAGQRYGFPIADNGSTSFIGLCGAPDARWDDTELAWMKRVKASDFEVVEMGTVITQVE